MSEPALRPYETYLANLSVPPKTYQPMEGIYGAVVDSRGYVHDSLQYDPRCCVRITPAELAARRQKSLDAKSMQD